MMLDDAMLGILCVLLIVQCWRGVREARWYERVILHEQQTHMLLSIAGERLQGLIEIEERKAHARAQLRTLTKGEGRALLRERLQAHLGG